MACADDEILGSSTPAAGASGQPSAGTAGIAGTAGAAGTAGQGGTAGASGQGGAGASGSAGAAGCPVLTLSQTKIFQGSVASFGIEARIAPTVSGAARSAAILELYEDDGSGELPPLKTGTFDLTQSPDDRYETCQHCVLVVAYDPSDQPTRVFFPKSGTVTVSKLDPEDRSVAAGSVADVSLVELTQKPDLSWEVLPGGGCFQLPSWSFDTTVTFGQPCERAEDCPNTTQQICDPVSRTCAHAQCQLTGDQPCAESQICRSQTSPESAVGACYDTCVPADPDACGGGAQCIPLGPVQAIGECRPTGAGKAGEACQDSDITTGCEAGHLCTGEPARCERFCDYLTASPGCPSDRVCGLQNVCVPATSGDPAVIGATCQPGAADQGDCGVESGAFRGLCLSLYPEEATRTCLRTCRTGDPVCPSGQSCLSIFENPAVGLCWPDAVCGDGVLDPVGGEVCDDGNAVDGDGCAADCKSAEFAPLCGKATALTLDQDITGTTVGGPTGYLGSCEVYQVIPTRTFAFTPPGPGTLSLEVTSSKDLDLLVLGDCADPTKELACRSTSDATESLDVPFTTAPAKPVLVAVRGNKISDVGAFTLRAHYTGAVCGDGLVAGPEACDDGNTTSSDGCSGDCKTIEWPQVCAALPTLSTTAPNAGTTVGGKNLVNTDGYCTSVLGSGREALFRYVAPASGVLSLSVKETTANFALYVLKGCGLSGDENVLACSNGGFPPDGFEATTVELTAGQEVTVVVDGFTPKAAGAFSLEATFK